MAVWGTEQFFSAVFMVKMQFHVFPANVLHDTWDRAGNAWNCIFTMKTAEKICSVPQTAMITPNMTFYISFELYKQVLTDFEIFDFGNPLTHGLQVENFWDFSICEMGNILKMYQNVPPKWQNHELCQLTRVG